MSPQAHQTWGIIRDLIISGTFIAILGLCFAIGKYTGKNDSYWESQKELNIRTNVRISDHDAAISYMQRKVAAHTGVDQ